MAKDWYSDEMSEALVLSPVEFNSPKTSKLKAANVERTELHSAFTSQFNAKPGNYHMVALDANGIEIPNSDFEIGERGYPQTYPPHPRIKVQKK